MKNNPNPLVVSLIGRPNVGKSSIFNRLMRDQSRALTYDMPGVTRDRHYGLANLDSHPTLEEEEIILVDTGGFYPQAKEAQGENYGAQSADPFFSSMAQQAELAIEESDLILFVVDIREGLLPYDSLIVDYLRKQKKEYILVINKVDSDKQLGLESEFFRLGMPKESQFLVSAEHGRGLEDLRIYLQKRSHQHQTESTAKKIQKGVKPNFDVVGQVAIIGAPNAGKSTLLNKLIGVERALVSPVAGTTIDPIAGYIDLDFEQKALALKVSANEFRKGPEELEEEIEKWEQIHEDMSFDSVEEQPEEEEEIEVIDTRETWRSIKLVDTAGIRKQGQISSELESQSVFRSLRAIAQADLVLFMVDVLKGITHQDRRLLDISFEKGKSVIIILNKMDIKNLEFKDSAARRQWLSDQQDMVPWLAHCEMVPLSALTGKGLGQLRAAIVQTMLIRHKKIPTPGLNRLLGELLQRNPVIPDGARGVRLKIRYASQVRSAPPTFIIYTNKTKGIPTHFRRYLVNSIRKQYELVNSPIHLIFR